MVKQVLKRKVPLHEQEFFDQHQKIEQLHKEKVPDNHSPVVVLAVIDRLTFDLKLLDLLPVFEVLAIFFAVAPPRWMQSTG